MVEEVAEGTADCCFLGVGKVVGLRAEDVLGAAADGPWLQLLDVVAQRVHLVLKESLIVGLDLLSLHDPLICGFVQLFQPVSVTFDALLEGILLHLANDRIHVLLDILLHHPDLLKGFGKIRSFPLVENGFAEGLKLCPSCLSPVSDHLLNAIVELIQIQRELIEEFFNKSAWFWADHSLFGLIDGGKQLFEGFELRMPFIPGMRG